MALKYSIAELSNAPKQKKAATCLIEKIHVLDKFPSSMSYNAVGCEFK